MYSRFRKLLRATVKIAAYTRNAAAALAALAGAALVILLVQNPLHDAVATALYVTYKADRENRLEWQDAFRSLKDEQHTSREISTDRAEYAFWLLTRSLSKSELSDHLIEIPSRHVTEIKFFVLDSVGAVLEDGYADRNSTNGHIRHSRAGYVIDVARCESSCRILLSVKSVGPARLNALLRSTADIESSESFFERSGGVLFGSLLMIAAFSFLIALLSREFTFFLFGAWVIVSLRLSSYTAGWDMGWLGAPLVEDFPIASRNVPLASYALLTVALFWSIFRKEVVQLHATTLIRILFSISLALLCAASVLSHKTFLPILWAVVIPCVATLIALTIRIYLRTGSSSAAWYGASWLATFSGALGDVAYAAGLTSGKPTLANSLAASLAGALLAGIAIAQRLNHERTGRLKAQRKTLVALEGIREMYERIPIGLFALREDGTIRISNPAFEHLTRSIYYRNNDIGVSIDDIFGNGTLDRLQRSAAHSVDQDIELHVASPNSGVKRWFLAKVTAKGNSIEGSIQDITERKEAEAQLRHLVDHDALTGLSNRRGLERSMSEAQSMVAQGVPCAVAHLALDRFKLINDLYGHGVGDTMLQMAASRLMQTVRARDHVARMADSFVVVFFDCPDFATLGLSERLREVIMQAPFEVDGKRLDMTASVGVVCFDPELGMVDTLASAGRACAEAKARGRNCVVRLDDSDNRLRSHLEELKVVADLKRKINPDRYFLDFQPIVSLHRPDESLNYEVLLRMRDEFGGVIPPGRFIGAAERNGLMSDIDRWVLRSTLEWLDTHPAHRDRLAFATINISGASLNDSRFIDDAFAMIADHPLAMPKLCFEITESVALNDLNSTRRFIDRVRQYGSKLALDDFGAGYTSFNYLKEIPADFIKIDGSFVRDINLNPANYAITRTIVDLTHELGMRSIAEWAETPETVEALIELGVDYGQGFGLARAMDKQIVTDAASCGTLVRDRRVLEIFATLSRDGVIAGN